MARPPEYDVDDALDASCGLFGRRGYEGTSVDDLVRELHVHRASLYRAFGSKNGLFLAATAAAYGMPLIVELGLFFDLLVAALIAGIYTHHIQDAFDSLDTSKLTGLKE